MLDQRVGLIDKENLPLSTPEHIPDPLRGLSRIACHQGGAPHFNELGTLKNADLIQNSGENARHRGFCRAGISAEFHVERHTEFSFPPRLEIFFHLGKCRNFSDLRLNLLEADQSVQFRQVILFGKGTYRREVLYFFQFHLNLRHTLTPHVFDAQQLIRAETLQLLNRKNTGLLETGIAAHTEFQILNENRIVAVAPHLHLRRSPFRALRLLPLFGNLLFIPSLLPSLDGREQ